MVCHVANRWCPRGTRGKSGRRRGSQLLTATKSNLRESATETTQLPPVKGNAMVKRVG